jgi:hypothetical protein
VPHLAVRNSEKGIEMIEKRFRWRVKSCCNPLTEVSLILRKFVADSPEESESWSQLQDELYGLAKCQAYYPLLINYCASYRQVLWPWRTNGGEISFIVCTEQADILFSMHAQPHPASKPTTRIMFDSWDANPDSFGTGYGWFVIAMGKKYKIAILSKDRQRCLTIVTTADAADELLKIIAPGCPSASASGLVFQKCRATH